MRIHEVEIENFRSIKHLAWRPPAGLTSLIGPGDSGKTTILDALGLVFSPRWGHVFTDNDFHGAPGGADDIVIRATVVDPPRELLRLEAFAGYVRGVKPDTGEIVDEPDDEDPALTVELRVDRYLEPVWQVVAARQSDPTPLRANQRATFGVVRIGSDSVTDLRWSRNSALLRMTGVVEHKPTAQALIDASRAAKSATSHAFVELDAVAKKVTDQARTLRAIDASATLTAALNSDSLQLGEGSVSLHEGKVPMERHGLGSRRLTGTSVQLADSADARVILLDEVESGLEPFRIRHLLRALDTRLQKDGSLGQVFLTTHSPVVLRELKHTQLGVVRRSTIETVVLTPKKNMQRMLRANPEAFLAPSVIVCEGATEVGIAREVFAHAESKDPAALTAVATADVNGESSLIEYAGAYVELDYRVGIFCDHDTTLDLGAAPFGVTVIRCDEGNCTEQQLVPTLGRAALAEAVRHGIAALGAESVTASFENRECAAGLLNALLGGTDDISEDDLGKLRSALVLESAKGKNQSKWFKSVAGGERLAAIVLSDPTFHVDTPAGRLTSALEAWGRG